MNKKKFFAPFALLGAFLLAGCSSTTVVSRPSWIDESIVDVKDLKDNKMKKIYDAIKELGDTNSNVLNTILHKISVGYFGKFNDEKNEDSIFAFASKSFDEVKGNAKFKEFIDNHKEAYGCKVETKIVNDKEEKLSDEEKLHVAHENLKNVYEQIIEDSYKAIYTEITGGTYSKNSLFNEEKYITNNIFSNMYIDLKTLNEARAETLHKDIEFAPIGLGEKYETYVKKYLLIGDVKDLTKSKYYGEYFTRKLIPDVYRTLLIQNYVKTQRQSTLARTYARKIKMVSVPAGSYTGAVGELFNNFSKNNIWGNEGYDFSLIEQAMRGNVGTDILNGTAKMLEDAGFKKITIKDEQSNETPLIWNYQAGEKEASKKNPTYVYYGTELGNLVEKYLKVYDVSVVSKEYNDNDHPHLGTGFKATVRQKVDETVYNDLTGTSAHSLEEGLLYKEREINKKTYAKEGWYLKSGTISELSTTYKDRLFNIETSTIIDTKTSKNYSSGDYARYVDVGGRGVDHAFLTYKSVSTQSDESMLVIKDGTNYSIVEIEEAVSTSKLADIDNKGSYYYKKGQGINGIIAHNKIENDVTIESSKGDTYKKNANQFYLMITNVIVSDQSLYDYLKGQFPDLFNN